MFRGVNLVPSLLVVINTFIICASAEGFYTNYANNVLTDGTKFFSVYPDPGTNGDPFLFETTDPTLTTWNRTGPPISYGTHRPSWALSVGYANHELNVIGVNRIALRVYFDVVEAATERRAIGVLYSTHIYPSEPDNFYIAQPEPLLRSIGNDISLPSLVHPNEDSDDLLLLYRDSNFQVHGQPLSYDGLSAKGSSAMLFGPTLDWEDGELTQAWGVRRGGHVYILYLTRAGHVGAARSSQPLGPYEKHPQPIGSVKARDSTKMKSTVQKTLMWGSDGWPFMPK